MIKVQNILILAALCISIYTAVIPIISPVKIDIKFQKWNGNGLSIWEIIFSQSCSCIRCPSGFVIEKGKCICPKGSIIIKDGRCIPDPTMDSIREQIWKWYNDTPIGNELTEQITQADSKIFSQDSSKICRITAFNYTHPTQDLINVDGSLDAIFPGAFVQSKYVKTGTESLVNLPIGQDVRYPILLASAQGNFEPFDVDPPIAGSVHKAIKDSILKSTGFLSPDVVYYDLTTSQNIQNLVVNFGFNAKILKKIDINGGFTGSWKTMKKKYILSLVQKIHTYYPDMLVKNPGQFADAVGVFLKPEFKMDYLERLKKFNYWGPGNPPLYVSQVYYGRIIVVTVDQNEYTTSLYAQIKGGSGSSSVQLSASFTKLFKDTSTRVFSVGPFSQVDIKALTSGDWQNFFQQMPANSSTILALKPIGFRLNDWQMRPVKVSNLIQYNNITCEDKPKNISLKFSDIYKTITVEIKKPGETSYTSITVTSGLNDITSFLAEGNNQIRIHNQVAKPSSFSRYQRKVTFQVLVNGQTKFGPQTSECIGCHSTGIDNDNAAFYCQKINKMTGDIICQKQS